MDEAPQTPSLATTLPGEPSQPNPPAARPIAPVEPVAWLSVPAMRYPNEYVWFILLSSMDVMLTWVILSRGGSEVNPLAKLVIDAWALPGAIMFKFSLMLLVIVICEVVGRLNDRSARILARLAVGVSVLPVIYSGGLLLLHSMYSAE